VKPFALTGCEGCSNNNVADGTTLLIKIKCIVMVTQMRHNPSMTCIAMALLSFAGMAISIYFSILPLALISFACGMVFLVSTLVAERLRLGPPPPELEKMELIEVNPGRISVSSREMIISDQWSPKSSAELRISDIPEILDVRLEFRVHEQHCMLSSIELKNEEQSGPTGSETLFVDTATLYFLNSQSLAEGIRPKALEKATMEMFDRTDKFEQQHTLLVDNEGRVCGAVCVTGMGDGQYQAIWGGDKGWSLKVRFL